MADYLQPEGLHRARGYSHAVQLNRTLYISGQVALDEAGNLVGKDDPRLQAEQVRKNLAAVLAAAGASPANLVKVTVYVVQREGWNDILQVLGSCFQKPYPANTTVQVASLLDPAFLLEVEAIAEVPESDA